MRLTAAAALAAALFQPAALWAKQEAPPTETGDAPAPLPSEAPADGRQVYLPQDFARFAPKSALDMLEQVPGFTIVSQQQGRGLGQANENVLVNGERLTGKSDSLFDQLRRISADRVVRIEIVDGATLAIAGLSGQVANVITQAGGISGQFEYRTAHRAHFAKPNWLAGEVSVSGTSGKIEWTTAISNNNGRGAAGGPSVITDRFGTVTETRETLLIVTEENPRLATTLKWDGPGSSVGNLNLSYKRGYLDFVNDEERDLIGGVDVLRDFGADETSQGYEIGGDFEFALGPGRLKLIGLERFDHFDVTDEALFIPADGSLVTGDRFAARTDSGERIGRGEYRWKMLGGDWQLDAEAAFNRLNRDAQLFALQPDGEFVETPFPGASGGVTEDRYETILTHGRSLTPRLTVQLGAGGEYSKLTQTGPGGLTRTFWRPKGSLSLAWAPRAGLDVSLKLARTVGQLQFGDFLARVFLDQENKNAGNAELVPPQSWEADLEVKKELGAFGSTTFKSYVRRIEDYIDIIPLADGGESRGNVDSAQLYGMDLKTTLKLDPLGWRGAKLDAAVILEKSSLLDPLTGVSRAFSNHVDRRINLDLRHDVPGSDWAWGGGLNYVHALPYYRLAEVGLDYEGPIYTYAFVEHKDVFGLTVNLQVFNLTNGRSYFRRTVYDGLRDRSPVLYVEDRNMLVGPIFRLQVKGSF